MKALDLSFSAVSREWCQARKAEGWELLIQNLWTGASTPTPARTNLVNARAAGMLTAGYTVVNMTPATAVNKAALAAGTEWEHLAFVSVDVEIATTPAIIRQAVDSLRTLGKKACIYTGSWFWGGVTGDFTDVPAWLADYDGNPAMDTARLARVIALPYIYDVSILLRAYSGRITSHRRRIGGSRSQLGCDGRPGDFQGSATTTHSLSDSGWTVNVYDRHGIF